LTDTLPTIVGILPGRTGLLPGRHEGLKCIILIGEIQVRRRVLDISGGLDTARWVPYVIGSCWGGCWSGGSLRVGTELGEVGGSGIRLGGSQGCRAHDIRIPGMEEEESL
jgi:hypothetical protein